MRFRDRIIRFMYGRNGMDKFNSFLFAIYFILMIVTWIVGLFAPTVMTLILNPILLLLAVYMTFRCLSRNIYKRQAENRRFLNIIVRFKDFKKLQKNKFKDRKTHVYKKCPNCSAVLRLKRIKGKHRAACPRCFNTFDVRVR